MEGGNLLSFEFSDIERYSLHHLYWSIRSGFDFHHHVVQYECIVNPHTLCKGSVLYVLKKKKNSETLWDREAAPLISYH